MIKPLIITAAGMLQAAAATAAVPENFSERMDSIFHERYGNDSSQPGGAVIVALGDSVLYERYFGTADMVTGEKIDSETLFNIASVSKQFTVAGLMQLVEKGIVSMDQPVSKHIDYPQDFWKAITLADLAGHTSGLPDSRDRSDRMRTILANDSTSIAYFPTVTGLKFKPGTAYDYLNPSFLILAKIIEDKTGKSFIDYQAENVFGPAGMSNTVYFDPAGMPAHTAHGYEPDDKGGWREFDYGEETFFATRPDGGIYATARDMLAWEKALAENTVVSEESREYMYAPRIEVSGSEWSDYQNRPFTWYGQGWFIDRNPEWPVTIYHTGDNGGFQAYVAKMPTVHGSDGKPAVVIVLENRHDRDRWSMARAITEALTR